MLKRQSLARHHRVRRYTLLADMPDVVFVILQPQATLTLKELTDFLLDKEIAKFKLPGRLEVVDDFPLSKFGKVSKHVLVKQISGILTEEKQAKELTTGVTDVRNA